jgi:hypothetical protein
MSTAWSSGDIVTAALPDGYLSGVIKGFNPSGCSALVAVTFSSGPWRPGDQVPVPVRLVEKDGGGS